MCTLHYITCTANVRRVKTAECRNNFRMPFNVRSLSNYIYIYIHINISVYIYRFCVDSSSILNSKETLWNTDLPTMISSTPPRKGTRRGVRPSSSVVENISAVPMCGPPKWTSQPVSKLSGSSLACPRGFVRLYQFITKYLYWSECSPFPTGWGTAITNWVGRNSKLAIYIYIYTYICIYIYIYIYVYIYIYI